MKMVHYLALEKKKEADKAVPALTLLRLALETLSCSQSVVLNSSNSDTEEEIISFLFGEDLGRNNTCTNDRP